VFSHCGSEEESDYSVLCSSEGGAYEKRLSREEKDHMFFVSLRGGPFGIKGSFLGGTMKSSDPLKVFL